MTDMVTMTPVFQETAATIRARMDADVNAGLAPGDPAWVDTRQGTFYYDITQVIVLELARIWDALSLEVVAAAFPIFAWGDYLDYHAQLFGLERKVAVSATGTVTFSGLSGSLIATGAVVSAPPPTPDGFSVEFATTASATIGPVVDVAATPSTTGGSLAAGTYYYVVTAILPEGETIASAELSAVTTGTTGAVTISWGAYSRATSYRIYRGTATGVYTSYVTSTGLNYTDTGATGTVTSGPPTSGVGAIDVPISAVLPGTAGNVSAGAIITVDSPLSGINAVTNAAATVGGTDVEDDEALRERVLIEFAGQGAGTINDYQRWALSRPGVGRVFVNPIWNGAGTVQVVVMTPTGGPVAGTVVTDVQNYLDPTAGLGEGVAPVGATVTVQTPSAITITVGATVTFKPGYSLTGTGGTVEQQSLITQALSDYIGGLTVGEDVIYQHVQAQFFRADGVLTVTGLTVNGAASDIAVTSNPPQIASPGTVTLS